MEKIVVIERRRTIGIINGEDIYVWELFDVMRLSQVDEWCKDRGYATPILSEDKPRNMFYATLEATLWDIGERG